MAFDLGSLGMSAAQGFLNSVGSVVSSKIQSSQQMKDWREQWNTAYSPQAQVRNLAAAGINPAVAFGQNAPVLSSGPSVPSVAAPSIGVQGLSDVGSYIQALANAKLAGASEKKTQVETDRIFAEKDAVELQNQITREYGLKQAAELLAKTSKEVALLASQNDVAKSEKALNDFKSLTEKVLAAYHGKQKELLEKDLESYYIKLQGNLEEQKSRIKANQANANQANSQASVNRETRRLQAALADIEESGKQDKIESLLARYQADGMISDRDYNEALLKVRRLADVQNKRDDSSDRWDFFREVDNTLDWLKDKISIFK